MWAITRDELREHNEQKAIKNTVIRKNSLQKTTYFHMLIFWQEKCWYSMSFGEVWAPIKLFAMDM